MFNAIKKKIGNPKKIIIAFLICAAAAVAGGVTYYLYFSGDDEQPVYTPRDLEHIDLPDEIMKFCFNHMPDSYRNLLTVNTTVRQIDKETARIQAIAAKFPEQEKITDRELKTWDKARTTLVSGTSKVESMIKDIYVLYMVNPDQGMAAIESGQSDINDRLNEALAPALELTRTLPPPDEPPSGIFQKTRQLISNILP